MKQEALEIRKPGSILIIKLSAIGDVVHTLPLLEVLRKNFPTARIDWLVEEEASQIITGHKGIDRVIVSYRKSWLRNFLKPKGLVPAVKGLLDFIHELRLQEYDLVIDLQGLFKSGLLTGLSRGHRKIGFTGGKEGSVLFLTERPYPVDLNRHAIERSLKAADYLKCKVDSWDGKIPLSDSDRTRIDRLLYENSITDNNFVAINPMARWKTKLWEPERFASLAGRIQKELSLKVVFTGSGHDRPIIDKIVQNMVEGPINLAGKTSLKELAYLFSRCRLVVSTDTGPMHIAAAMGTPTVALFGPTAPWRTGPYGMGHKVVREELDCSPCFKKRCTHLTCMKKITPEKIFEAVQQVLQQRSWGKI